MYASDKIPAAPAPSNPDEAARWEHTSHRLALMEGRWRRLLEDYMEAQLGTTRRMAMGVADTSVNSAKVIWSSLATLYDAEPDCRHHGAGDVPTLLAPDGLVARSGLWAQMQRFQALTIALNEMWMRIDVEDGRLTYRPIPPNRTIAESDPARPTYPKAFAELRLRRVEGQHVWCWDVLDIRDESNPRYEIRVAGDGGTFGADVTLQVLGATYSGDAYPYRRAPRADGTLGAPILPVVLYHASLYGDRLFDPYYGIETYTGAVQLALLYTYLGHTIRDASYPQRWAIGVRVAGADIADGSNRGARVEVVTDPTTILMLDAAMEQQPQVGQFAAGSDVSTLEKTISAIAHRLATDAGLAPSELQRTSGSAQSGYAISLNSEGKRVAQRKYIQQFKRADEELLAKSAILYNRAMGTSFPEGGYSVIYREIPLSPEELEARRKHAIEMMGAGLMDRVEALRLFGFISEADAVARLAQIDASMAVKPAPVAGQETSEDAPTQAAPEVSTPDEVVEEVQAAEAALAAILDDDRVPAPMRKTLAAIAESLGEALGYLGVRPLVEAQVEIHDDVEESDAEQPTDSAAPDESVAAAATSAGVPASAVALNGAQVQAAQGIITSVAKGELPRSTGVQMLVQFFNMAPDAADALMGEVGASFTIAAPEAP